MDKFEKSQTVTQNLLFDMHDKMEKGKSVDTSYSTKDIAQNSAAPASNVNVQYGMPPNYFVGQSSPPGTVRPTTAEPVRPVASTGQTVASAAGPVRPVPQTGQTGAIMLASTSARALAPIPSSAAAGRTDELEGFVPPYTTKSLASHLFHPLCHKMFGTI